MTCKGYIAGVGSRTVPEWALELMIRLGRTYTDLGYQMSSGDAWDSDRAFLYGASQSTQYHSVGARVYLHKDGANNRWVKDNPFYYDASTFDSTTTATALSMAALARGSFYGLSPAGVLLHTRNVYQIHGTDLASLVSGLYFYAETKGKTKVSGGTNTALQVARTAKVPLIRNLYLAEDVALVEQWLAENELPYPYKEIDWHQIHKPDDPRLLEFEL